MNKSKGKRMSIAEQFGSVEKSANDFINMKLLEEQRNELRNIINMRFGPTAWDEIISERANRIQERKEAELIMRKKKAKEAKELIDGLKMIGWMVLFAVVVLGGMFAALKFYMT